MGDLLARFEADPVAKRYRDVTKSGVVASSYLHFVNFFDDPHVVRRMIESEKHHDRPALAGVVRDLENLVWQQIGEASAAELKDGPTAMRRNQLIGVIVRLTMENAGWKPTGKKGSLAGLSRLFKRAERYAPIVAELR